MYKHRPGALCSILLFLILLFLSIPSATASAQRDSMDTRGKMFWVSFLANWGGGTSSESSDLRLYISSDRPTNVKIVYGRRPSDTFRISIDQPHTSYTVDINMIFGDSTELKELEPYSKKSFQVIAQDDITLYGVNIRNKSADAFLALPEDVLSGTYIVLAYPNGLELFSNRVDMPSQFAVVATEDGTTVRITPPPGTTLNETMTAPYMVNLSRGDVYFAQAKLEGLQDVSGTEIASNKPVAVFAGNRRTSIPTSVGNYRDHLIEQIPPLEVWGMEAIIAPHFPVSPVSSAEYSAVVRILAAFDETELSIDGVFLTTLQRGVSYEIELTGAMRISASGPILVAQYEHSVGEKGGGPDGEFGLGDPFMMLVPPSEQFDTAYSFQSVAHSEFRRHFINVVVPTAAIASVQLDGTLLVDRDVSFVPVPGTDFSYAQIEVQRGSHRIRADAAFGLYVYGFGAANSYGYTGGMLFRRLVDDFFVPVFDADMLCGVLAGQIFETQDSDSGIDSLYVYDSVNVRTSIDPFVSPADSVGFRMELIDPYQDGSIAIVARDSVGRVMRRKIRIPGFTLRTTTMTTNQPARYDTLVAFNELEFCRTIVVENYGEFPQTIDEIAIESAPGQQLSHREMLPLVLAPGEKREITICAVAGLAATFDATVRLIGDCIGRDVALIPIVHRIDSLPPDIERPVLPCGDDLSVNFSETDGSGIESFIVEQTINCVASYTPSSDYFPSKTLQLSLHRVDPRHDMIYHVTLTDRVGNRRQVRDTIGGFTVAAVDFAGDTLGLTRSRALVGDSLTMFKTRCDSIVLSNYGSQPLPISQIAMRGNIGYSIPPSQIPLVIPPYGQVTVQICIEGRAFGNQIDTLVVFDQCGLVEQVMVMAHVEAVRGTGTDNCNNALFVEQYAPSKRTFLQTPLPNPASGPTATVDIGMTEAEQVALEVFGADGEPALTILRGIELGAGISRVTFDISTLDAGVYFCRLITTTGGMHVQKLVIAR